jgi:hypothetical protein
MKTRLSKMFRLSALASALTLCAIASASDRAPIVVKKITAKDQSSPTIELIVNGDKLQLNVDEALEQGVAALHEALGALEPQTRLQLQGRIQDLVASLDTSAVRENAERVREAARAAADSARAAAQQAKAVAESIDVREIRDTVRRAMEDANVASTWSYRTGGDEVQKSNPYSARETREFKQTLGDGTVISRQSTRLLARDGEGRTRQELRQPDGTARIFINDPVAKRTYIIDPQKRTACKAGFDKDAINDCFKQMRGDWKPLGFSFSPTNRGIPMMSSNDDVQIHVSSNAKVIDLTEGQSASGRSKTFGWSSSGPVPPVPPVAPVPPVPPVAPVPPVPPIAPIPPLPPMLGSSTSGGKVVRETNTTTYEGLRVDTNRSVETIAVGAMGNNRPIESVFERYYSPDLKMTVFSRRSDPRSGESIYRMTEIKRSEPDANQFRVPAGFSEIEGKAK